MAVQLKGFQRKLHHTRYAKKTKDKEKYLNKGQPVVVLTKDGRFPTSEIGTIDHVYKEKDMVKVAVKLESGDGVVTKPGDIFVQDLHNVDIVLETEYEETADRVAKAVASVEKDDVRDEVYKKFKHHIENFNFVPAGRILAGAGDDNKVTLFNCYVLSVEKPPHCPEKGVDSRQAIFHHMGRIAEVMARGGGVGTCLSVFRPRHSKLSQTNGKSTGAVFIGNMFSSLTNFIEQGNRRGTSVPRL